MKKISTSVVIAIIIIAGILNSCDKKVKTPLTKEDGNTCNKICADFSNLAFQDLDDKMLKVMSAGYKTTYQKTIATARGIKQNDASSIWFNLETLKQFIWEIEHNVCINKSCDSSMKINLGIRIYYAQYPTTGPASQFKDLHQLPDNYENMHTVFMIPTYDEKNNPDEHIDFDPRKPFNKSCFPTPLNPEGTAAKVFGLTVFSKNHGGICPPTCPSNNKNMYYGQ